MSDSPSVAKARKDLAYVESEYPLTKWRDPLTGKTEYVVDVYRRRLAKAIALAVGATR